MAGAVLRLHFVLAWGPTLLQCPVVLLPCLVLFLGCCPCVLPGARASPATVLLARASGCAVQQAQPVPHPYPAMDLGTGDGKKQLRAGFGCTAGMGASRLGSASSGNVIHHLTCLQFPCLSLSWAPV